jgi:feruloyl esterase
MHSRLLMLISPSTIALCATLAACGGSDDDNTAAPPASVAVTEQQCAALASQKITNVTITQAVAVTTGSFVPPDATVAVNAPSFCRVSAVSKPTTDSVIKFEVWMPLAGWNGKLDQGGNGGYGRGFTAPNSFMVPALRRGYAVSGTDMGHPLTVGYDASWAYGHPDKLIDWASRANHETAVASKALIAALYGQGPKQSYFTGCSDGGHEALMEAQRFPDDFQGIAGGALANNWTGQSVAGIWQTRAMVGSGLTAAKLPMIQAAAIAACDANDGVTDGLIEHPQTCHFDPATIACPAGTDSATCLTAPQVDAVKAIYAGPVNPTTGLSIYPGEFPGSEALWSFPIAVNAMGGIGTDYFRYMVYSDPAWDFNTLDYSHYLTAAGTASAVVDSTNANLDGFRGQGGKFIMYHGLADQAIYPQNSANYLDSVGARLAGGAGEAKEFIRLFYVPGMPHCGGGIGVDTFDALTALENWVEKGTAPDMILGAHTGATNGANMMTAATGAFTRPLCAYPQVAKYSGTGSTSDAANFTCAAP